MFTALGIPNATAKLGIKKETHKSESPIPLVDVTRDVICRYFVRFTS